MHTPITNAIVARQFLGQYSNADPRDIPDGASVRQVNISTNEGGRFRVREGVQLVTIENDDEAPLEASTVIAMFNYQSPAGEIVVYQLANGKVKEARGIL